MFEDFRKQSENASFSDDTTEEPAKEFTGRQHGYFLGMTPAQRFILALMVLIMTVILGVLFLMVTSKILLPFFG